MSKAANTYWDSESTGNWAASKRSTPSKKRRTVKNAADLRRPTPWWVSFAVFISIFVMLCIAINFRAFTEMREEVDMNAQLATKVQSLTDENLALQEEIHMLKTDPTLIQREARRIGIDLRHQKVPVPVN